MNGNEEELRQSDEGYALMGAAFEVYNELGPGFLEEVYQEAMEMVLDEQNIPFVSKPHLDVWFHERKLQKHYEADLLIEDQIVVELKAVRTLTPEHEAQLLNKLKITRKRIGYLINFGASPRLQWSRRVL